MTDAEEVDLSLPATGLSRRTALQLGGTVAGGLAAWVLVPSLMRAGPPAAQPLTTSFGDVTVLAVTLVSAAQAAGGRQLRHGVWRDALTATVALRNRT